MKVTNSIYSFYSVVVLLWLLCCVGTFTATTISLNSPPSAHTNSVQLGRLSFLVLCGGLNDNDFSSIFGKQEMAERQIRDLASEFHRRSTAPPTNVQSPDLPKGRTRDGGAEIMPAPPSNKTAPDKVVRKYVAPPGK